MENAVRGFERDEIVQGEEGQERRHNEEGLKLIQAIELALAGKYHVHLYMCSICKHP
jgi:hypothetical protein